MRKINIVQICISLLIVLLTGCELTLSPEDKINIAFPLPESVRIVKASMLGLETDEQKKEFERQFNSRMKLRALNCTKGYSPSWYASPKEIRAAVDNKPCFAEIDKEMAKWLGMRKVGLLLAQPASRPVPATMPSVIAADEFIQSVRFAENAGVALIETQQSIELVDMATSKLVMSEAKGMDQSGPISPNGRLFVVGGSGVLRIKDVETGDVVAEIDSVRPFEFHWLDEHTAVYSITPNKTYLVDFDSGQEIAVPDIGAGYLFRGVRVPGEENRYIFLFGIAVAEFELDRSKVIPEVKLLSDNQFTGVGWSTNNSGLNADASYYFNTNYSLTLVDMKTMKLENIPFSAFNLQISCATPDPDKILVSGYIQPHRSGDGPMVFLYSISEHTMSRVDTENMSNARYVYIDSLRKQGVINFSSIQVKDELPTLDKTDLAEFVSSMLVTSNQRKLEDFETQQTRQFNAGRGVANRYLPAQRGIASSRMYAEPNSLISKIAHDAQVEAVGVYQGKVEAKDRTAHKMGNAEVHIRRSEKPIVLVLSSYEPVRWKLKIESGAKLAAVLVSGYYQSEVVGAGNARIISAGSAYTYEKGNQGYYALDREVKQWTAKHIDIFQGRYEGSSFSVGGN